MTTTTTMTVAFASLMTMTRRDLLLLLLLLLLCGSRLGGRERTTFVSAKRLFRKHGARGRAVKALHETETRAYE